MDYRQQFNSATEYNSASLDGPDDYSTIDAARYHMLVRAF